MKIGIVGSGSIVETFMDAALKVDGAQPVALFSRSTDSERACYLSKKYNLTLFSDFDEMISDSNIDFIYVASPNSLHYYYSLKALKNKKNVICEKPFTSTINEAEELYKAAKENNVMLFEGIATIHYPNYKIIKDNLFRVGNIKIAQLNFSQYSSRYDYFLSGGSPNVFNPKYSGGSLMDINIYNIHFMLGLFGLPESSSYFPNLHENGIDTSGVLIMKYPKFIASLTGAKDSVSNNFCTLQGEKGCMYINTGANSCDSVTIEIFGEKSKITLNNQFEQNRLYYEVFNFKSIYENRDYNEANSLCEYSIKVIGFVENLRKSAGIYFEADNSK
ncbi:MAG: Gfo/Idh/MocA family oxidoreductase [Clostridiales bacterium]|jgi:predicted dehydrogenase|nr:Gfo/Idh/MocA family oxidoreductase [Clostridiales bacterium]